MYSFDDQLVGIIIHFGRASLQSYDDVIHFNFNNCHHSDVKRTLKKFHSVLDFCIKSLFSMNGQ